MTYNCSEPIIEFLVKVEGHKAVSPLQADSGARRWLNVVKIR